MSSRRAVLSVLLGLIALPGAGARAADAPADSSGQTLPVLEQVVATVDDEVVLLGEIVADVQYHALQQGAMPSPAEQRELLQEARDRRIEEKLLVAKAKRDQIQIGDEDLNMALDGHIDQLRKQAGGDAGFARELDREGITERELRRNLREPMREQLLAQRVVERLSLDTQVGDEELRGFYEQNKNNPEIIPLRPKAAQLSHIVVIPQASPERERELRDKLAEIHRRLDAGEDFGDIAKALSQGPAAARGGDLGWWDLKDIALPELALAVANLPPGAVTDDVQSEQGYHVLKMEERDGQRVHFRQIFVPLPISDGERQAARDRAREAWQRLQAGEDWDKVVAEYSDDTPTKDKGGLLPPIPEEQLDDRYLSIVEALEPGEYSGVFLGKHGYQILRLESRDASRAFAFDEVADQLRTQLIARKRNQAIQNYLGQLEQELLVTRVPLPPLEQIAGLSPGG
ncbi:peptidylprolyl isomerase [bacterium]|nr:peptidylprolyl isomerase [bacterium]